MKANQSYCWLRKTFASMDKGVFKETTVLRRWRVERNVWFINRVDN